MQVPRLITAFCSITILLRYHLPKRLSRGAGKQWQQPMQRGSEPMTKKTEASRQTGRLIRQRASCSAVVIRCEPRLRQSASIPCLYRALSDGRRLSCPPVALSLWPARHAHIGGAGKRAARAGRARLRRRCPPPSGLAAISTALLSFSMPAITCWSPTASIYRPGNSAIGCSRRYGIATTLLRSADRQRYRRAYAAKYPRRIRGGARLAVFEIQDVPAIAASAHAHGARGADGQYLGEPALLPRLREGVDLSIQAATKYLGGHSDVMLGTVSANKATWPRLREQMHLSVLCVGPDDMYLGLRGLRTLGVRLSQHYRSGLQVAQWLAQRPEIACVLHPALASCPGHQHWRRDFS